MAEARLPLLSNRDRPSISDQHVPRTDPEWNNYDAAELDLDCAIKRLRKQVNASCMGNNYRYTRYATFAHTGIYSSSSGHEVSCNATHIPVTSAYRTAIHDVL